MYSVYQHWDPLRVCAVGRSYPPEFYSWIKVPHVRDLFERIARETEEDYQGIIDKLNQFGVKVLRPNLPTRVWNGTRYINSPMTPRDHMIMVGSTLYSHYNTDVHITESYDKVKDPSWPLISSLEQFFQLPDHIQQECQSLGLNINEHKHPYHDIFEHVRSQGNTIANGQMKNPRMNQVINGAFMTRVGRDLYFGTEHYNQDRQELKSWVDQEFVHTRNHIINTGGHSDSTFCPVAPGLIISLKDVPTYADTFPDWEVVYLPNQSWGKVIPFLNLKRKNGGKWWIPGFEHDQDVIDTVEVWLKHWVGYVEETVFDVNMLVIDPKNVMVFNYNKQVFDALARHGITPHVVPFRHRYFWDGGIHCVTADLDRDGTMQDFFPSGLTQNQ